MRLFVLILAILLDQIGLGSVVTLNNFDINKSSSRADEQQSLIDNIKPGFYKDDSKTSPIPEVTSKSFIVLDSNTGNVISEKESNIKVPMASLTKVMTAVIVLENSNLDDNLTVSKNAVSAYGEGIDLHYDENLTVKDTLYAALLSSSNDACVALAEKISGSEEDFVKLMNKKAEMLGLLETQFINSSGLDADGHFSSVSDLAKLTRYALLNKTFKEIVSTKDKTITSKEGISHFLRNTNRLLGNLDGVTGVKTGLTGEAGECLITLVEKDGSSLIVVVLGSDDRFSDTKNLINWVYENYSWK